MAPKKKPPALGLAGGFLNLFRLAANSLEDSTKTPFFQSCCNLCHGTTLQYTRLSNRRGYFTRLGQSQLADDARDAAVCLSIAPQPAQAALFARVKDDGRAEAALIAVAGMRRADYDAESWR
jgi:hypothetical protein